MVRGRETKTVKENRGHYRENQKTKSIPVKELS